MPVWRFAAVFAFAQAQGKADKDAENAKAAIQAAQEQASDNEARAEEAEQKLAAEVAARSEGDNKFTELEVNVVSCCCTRLRYLSVCTLQAVLYCRVTC